MNFHLFCGSCKCIGHVPGKCRPGSADLPNATSNLSSNLILSSIEIAVVPPVTENAEQDVGCDVGKLEDFVVVLSPDVIPFIPTVHDLGSLVLASHVPLPVHSMASLVSVDEVVAAVSPVKASVGVVVGVRALFWSLLFRALWFVLVTMVIWVV